MLNLREIFARYKDLNWDEKGLLFIRWVKAFESLVKSTFVNIYIFTIQQSIYQVLWIGIFGYFCTTIWYWLHSFLLTRYRLNVKKVLQASFIISILSFIIMILRGSHLWWMVLFTFVNGIARWFYFSSIIYFESHNIKDKKNDFYGSMVYIIKKSLGILSPLIITLLFLVPSHFDVSWYSLIFGATIIVNLLTILYSNKISNHQIDKIPAKELNIKKLNRREISYYLTFGMYNSGKIILALVLLYVLNSEVNIWFYETILAIAAIFLVLKNSIKTNKSNRKKYYTIFGIIMWLNALLFGMNLTLVGLIIYTIIDLLIAPVFGALRFGYYFHFLENNKEHRHDKFIRVVNADFWTQLWRISFLWVTLLGVRLAPIEIALTIAMIIYSLNFLATILVVRKIW